VALNLILVVTGTAVGSVCVFAPSSATIARATANGAATVAAISATADIAAAIARAATCASFFVVCYVLHAVPAFRGLVFRQVALVQKLVGRFPLMPDLATRAVRFNNAAN